MGKAFMKFSLWSLITVVTVASVLFAFIDAICNRPAKIVIGMSRQNALVALETVAAQDISPCIIVSGSPKFDPETSVVWWLETHGIYIETVFYDAKVSNINVWDLEGRTMDQYYHQLKHESVSQISLSKSSGRFNSKLIETVYPAEPEFGELYYSPYDFD